MRLPTTGDERTRHYVWPQLPTPGSLNRPPGFTGRKCRYCEPLWGYGILQHREQRDLGSSFTSGDSFTLPLLCRIYIVIVFTTCKPTY